MSLPPPAPGRLFLESKADLVAYLERDDQAKFECLVRYVAGLPEHGARSAFLDRFRKRHSETETDRVRRAAWALMNPGVTQERPFQDYVSELEELFA